MKQHLSLLWLAILYTLTLTTGCSTDSGTAIRNSTPLNDQWIFTRDDMPAGTSDTISLPHTPRLEPLVVTDQWQGICRYEYTLTLPQGADRKVFLYVEGAMQKADVVMDGDTLRHHTGGYLPFLVDLGTNEGMKNEHALELILNNRDDSLVPPGKPLSGLDFSYYGGLYRPAHLITTPLLHLTNAMEAGLDGKGGLRIIQQEVDSNQATLKLIATIKNDQQTPATFTLKQQLTDREGGPLASVVGTPILLAAGADTSISLSMVVSQPPLWSPEDPHLVKLHTSLIRDGKVTDELTTRTGLRKAELVDGQFYLNGQKRYLRGTNRHQEYPYVGYALSDQAQWRDAVKIKNAGFDMVRLSHYPQSEAFMDACDSLGIITMDCIPGWQFNGGSEFRAHVLQDVRELIRRDRNRASVIFWELSLNESMMEPSFMDSIIAVKNEELPNQKVITCAWTDHPAYDLFIPARQHGQPPLYWNQYQEGRRPVFIAEYGDWEYYAQNAGFNQKDFADLKEDERTSRQAPGASEQRLLQQALNFQEAANSNRRGVGTIGHANWLMFDYNRGYTDDLETSGIAGIFRVNKPVHEFYRSQRDAGEHVTAPATGGPMISIATRWQNDNNGTVRVYSNCDSVALWLNGELLGIQQPDHNTYSDHLPHPPFTFLTPGYKAGELKAIGYWNGVEAATDLVRTPDVPHSLSLTPDLEGVEAAGNDIIMLHARVMDQHGTTVPLNGFAVHFTIEGSATLIGDNPAQTEAGVATILIRTRAGSGACSVSASAEQLPVTTTGLQFHSR